MEKDEYKDSDSRNELLLEGVGCIRDSKGTIVEGQKESVAVAVTDTRKGSSAPYSAPEQTTFDFSLKNRKLDINPKEY